MSFISDFNQLIAPYASKISNMVTRGLIKRVDDAAKMQIVQVDLLEDETRDDLERVQNYGFTSNPATPDENNPEAVVAFVAGQRDHGLVIAVDDRRYRLRNLAAGEVAVYDKTGSKVVLKANGDIEFTPSSGTVKFTGDVTVSGTLTATTDVVGGGKSLKTHTHVAGTLITGPSAGSPVTGITGGPV